MDKEILEYCLFRRSGDDINATNPTWAELSEELQRTFGISVSVSGLRGRVSEYRRIKEATKQYVPNVGFQIPSAEEWGSGLAPIVERTTNESFETVVSLSDIHFPYHNKALLLSTLRVMEDIDPHVIVLNGDVNDFFQLSRFNQGLERLDNLQEEIDMGYEFRKTLRNTFPNAVIRENLGNHDERILSYIENNARSLASLRALKPENLLGILEFDIELYGRAGHRIRPEFVFEHGHIVRSEAGASAKARLNSTLISGIMGHTHRMAEYPKSGYKDLAWYEQGCLCDRDAEYKIGETNWQPGFAVCQFSTKTDTFHVDLIRAVGNGYLWGGKSYGMVDIQDRV